MRCQHEKKVGHLEGSWNHSCLCSCPSFRNPITFCWMHETFLYLWYAAKTLHSSLFVWLILSDIHQEAMVKLGCLDKLIHFISFSHKPAVQLKALEVLLYFDGLSIYSFFAILNQLEKHQKAMIEKNLVPNLIALMNTKDATLQTKALELVQYFDSTLPSILPSDSGKPSINQKSSHKVSSKSFSNWWKCQQATLQLKRWRLRSFQ